MRQWGLEEPWPLPGAHILHIYLDEAERRLGLLDFIAAGLQQGERVFCVHDRTVDFLGSDPRIGETFPPAPGLVPGPGGAAVKVAVAAAWLKLAPSRAFYLQDGVFDHGRVFREWQDFVQESHRLGYPRARALGEVLPELEQLADGKAVVLYESALDTALQSDPPTCVVCQYDARAFRGATLIAILRVHPLVLVEGCVYANPMFEQPVRMTSH
jgi:hypothetical protein